MKKLSFFSLSLLISVALTSFLFNATAVHAQALSSIPQTNFHYGAQGIEVQKLQDALVNLGYLQLTADQYSGGYGIFGRKTRAALEQYQADSGISGAVNGYYYGPHTRESLQNDLGAGESNDLAALPPLPTQPTFQANGIGGGGNSNQPASSPDTTAAPPSVPTPTDGSKPAAPQVFSNDIFAASQSLIEWYKQSGDCKNNLDYRNCPGHTTYPTYWTHKSYMNPSFMAADQRIDRKCSFHPTLAYLRDEIPKYFSWAKDNSDCRVEVINGNVDSKHLVGKAIDFGGMNTVKQGTTLAIALQQSNNSILGINYIIFNAYSYTKTSNGSWAGPNSYHGGPGVCKNSSGPDDCHYNHVHIQLP